MMLPDNNIQKELETLGCSCLTAGLPMPFTVPEDYFNTLPGIIGHTVTQAPDESLPAWLNMPALKQAPFTIPADYFEQLSGQVLARPELRESMHAPVKNRQQQVPEGYFDSLAETILNRAKATETPVVSLAPRKKNRLKYAVAAAITGLVILTGINYFTGTPAKTGDSTAAIDAQVSTALQSVPEQNLEQMVTTLANETVAGKTTLPATDAKNNATVAGLLNEVSTAELASFLTDFDEDADDEAGSTIN